MRTHRDSGRRLFVCLASVGAAALFPTACGSSTQGTSNSAAGTASTAAATATLTIASFTLSPLTVKGGDTITVTNADAVEHTVTIASEGIDVKVPAKGQSTFTAPTRAGTYALTCDFHKQMNGTLTVT
jgi:plastocyanin